MALLHDDPHLTSTQRDLGQQAQNRPPPWLRQRRPNQLTGVAHRGIPANEPAPVAPRGRVSAVPPSRLNYQRLHVWGTELAFKRLKSLLHIDKLRTRTEEGTRCWLYAHLIVALLCDDLSQEFLDFFPSGAV